MVAKRSAVAFGLPSIQAVVEQRVDALEVVQERELADAVACGTRGSMIIE
jgi:hypothetical protein